MDFLDDSIEEYSDKISFSDIYEVEVPESMEPAEQGESKDIVAEVPVESAEQGESKDVPQSATKDIVADVPQSATNDTEVKALMHDVNQRLSNGVVTGGAEANAKASLYVEAQSADSNNTLVQKYLAEIEQYLADD